MITNNKGEMLYEAIREKSIILVPEKDVDYFTGKDKLSMDLTPLPHANCPAEHFWWASKPREIFTLLQRTKNPGATEV